MRRIGRDGRDGHLDQSEAYYISQLVRQYGLCIVNMYITIIIVQKYKSL